MGTPTEPGDALAFKKLLWGLIGLPFVLGGCSALGLNTTIVPNTSPTTPAPSGPASGWIVVATGSPTAGTSLPPSPGMPPPALPPVSIRQPDQGCQQTSNINDVFIPLTVTPGKGSFTVSWPQQWKSDYQITAVPQPLVSGNQPAYTWRSVPASNGCTVTTTITGLKSRVPYVIWLDAPHSGHELDGARHPYSGRSGVVYPL